MSKIVTNSEFGFFEFLIFHGFSDFFIIRVTSMYCYGAVTYLLRVLRYVRNLHVLLRSSYVFVTCVTLRTKPSCIVTEQLRICYVCYVTYQ